MISDTQLHALGKLLSEWSEQERTGSIEINFFKGGISNVSEHNSNKMPDLEVRFSVVKIKT